MFKNFTKFTFETFYSIRKVYAIQHINITRNFVVQKVKLNYKCFFISIEVGEEQHLLCNISHCAPHVPVTCQIYSVLILTSLVSAESLCA